MFPPPACAVFVRSEARALCVCAELCGEVVLIRRLPGETGSVAAAGSYTMSSGSPPRAGLARPLRAQRRRAGSTLDRRRLGRGRAALQAAIVQATTFTTGTVPA